MSPYTVFVAAMLLAVSGCAALDEAAVARTDRLNEAPFYKAYADVPPGEGAVLVLPLRLESEEAVRLRRLAGTIEDYLATAECCRLIAALPADGAPLVYVGSSEGENVPLDAPDMREYYEEYPPMIVHYAKPSAAWREELRELADRESANRIIVTQLDFVQYPKADRGFFGKKVVLGTGHEKDVRFFSAVDKPIEVLQLSAVLLDQDGRELCAGAEGIHGSDAPFWVQMLDAGKDIDDATLERILTAERREDLPGAPLNWQAAVDQLLWNLLQRCN